MASPFVPSTTRVPGGRLVAIDWMRGLVMLLMALDHSSGEFNAGRLFTDGSFVYQRGMPIPAAQFLTRWVTHLCAPTFVFLAGASLAIQVRRREAAGDSAWAIDRHLLVRGLVIAGFEVWVSLFWMPFGRILLQVLYAIGTSYLFMIPLRRAPTALLVAFASAVFLFGEKIVTELGWGPSGTTPILASLLMVPGRRGALLIAYPTLPWLAILLLGWASGRLLTGPVDPRNTSGPRRDRLRTRTVAPPLERRTCWRTEDFKAFGRIARRDDEECWRHFEEEQRRETVESRRKPTGANMFGALALSGVALLTLFGAVRGHNQYGNMGMPREDGSVVQWLHVSKYPPSLSFVALELGVMALVLALLAIVAARASANPDGLLMVLGRTPMFFYLLHIPLLVFAAHGLGVAHRLGLGWTYLGAAAVIAVLYPFCRAYGRYKAAHPTSWTRYV